MEVTVNYDYREADVRKLLDVEKLALFVIGQEKKPDTTEVSINFVSDEAIWELNREYRNVDGPTDVLSFECDGFEGADDAPVVDGMAFELGDIVVAPDVAERQARDFGLTFAEEVSLLITHGLLHLCGYDHMQDDEAEVMEARERELLSVFWDKPFSRFAAEGSV